MAFGNKKKRARLFSGVPSDCRRRYMEKIETDEIPSEHKKLSFLFSPGSAQTLE